MKYRIVSRNKHADGQPCHYLVYFAQMNVFGTWVDCHLNPFVESYNSYDMDLRVVEKRVNSQLIKKEPLKDEVVKTYD
jgi:hypothetical protein